MTSLLNELSCFSSTRPELIGVNVTRTGDITSHCGLLYTHRDGGKKFLHLASHFELEDEIIDLVDHPERYRWVELQIDEYLSDSVAEWCVKVKEKESECIQNRIPYGFFYFSTIILDDGLVKIGENESGLSCSTFVLALLSKAGVELIELKSWEPRDQDKLVHESLITALNCARALGSDISEKHIDNVSKDVGCLRYRPEEIAAASTFSEFPAKFNETSALGEEIFINLPWK